MNGSISNVPVGKCSRCGGVVSLPKVWHGVNRPVPTCESCGAKSTGELPVIKTTGCLGVSIKVSEHG